MPMNYTAVSSSMVVALAYDDVRRVMGVLFRNGDEYHYHEVSKETFETVRDAPSVGQAFDSHIKKAGVKWEKIR